MPDDVLLIGAVNLKSKTTKSGKERYRVEVSGDSIAANLDPKALGRAPADAMAEILKERITGITAVASKATVAARKVAAKAFAAGETWATRRYSGGKTGATSPNQSDRLFNDSGRFANGIAVGATNDGYTINCAANRLDPSTFNGGATAIATMFERLKTYVPELGDPSLFGNDLRMRRALTESAKQLAIKIDERTASLKTQFWRSALGLVRQVASFGR